MRHIGSLQNEKDAQRFAAYLVTEGTVAHAEKEGDEWAIWVRDENQVAEAKEALEDYRHNPDRPAYQGAERVAESIHRDEARKREVARKNIIQMRGRWARPGTNRRRPLTLTVIGLCILVGLVTNMGKGGLVLNALRFCDAPHLAEPNWSNDSVEDRFVDIRQGQIWRLVTPIFVHYGPWHLLFNMIMFYQLGSLIEDRRGTTRFGLMVIIMGIASSLGEPLVPSEWGGTAFAAGLSGVVFGLLAYAWVKTIYEPELGIRISRNAVTVLVVFLFLGFAGILRQLGLNVANWAHGFGFASGLAIAYLPLFVRSAR